VIYSILIKIALMLAVLILRDYDGFWFAILTAIAMVWLCIAEWNRGYYDGINSERESREVESK